jgi:hypothetical protein
MRYCGLALALGLVLLGCAPLSSPPGASTPEGGGGQRFTEVAEAVGLHFRHGAFRWEVSPDPVAMLGGGVCWLDYDGDGWLDLFVVNSYSQREADRWSEEGGLPRSALFHNVEGQFVDVSSGSGADMAVRGNGCVAADFDLDGRTDLFVTTASGGALLWNEGEGRFTEGARDAGIDAFGWLTGAAVGDVNGDGWPDLFLAGYVNLNNPVPEATQGFPNTYLGVRDRLHLSNGRAAGGRVTFWEVGVDAGLEVVDFEPGLGAVFSDLDRDGDLDLYVANDTAPNRLYRNVAWPGGAEADPVGLGFRFEELAGRAGVADSNAGMGVAVGDYDGDTRLDLFVTNARGQVHGVFRGRESEPARPSFEDVRYELGPDLGSSTGWGVSWIDLDLDTNLDLFVVNGDIPVTDLAEDAAPLQMFRNLTAQGAPGLFEDLSVEVGLREVGSLLARGSAAADYDNDGDIDIVVNTIGGSLVLLENIGPVGNWLQVRLDGFHPGALVTVVLPHGLRLTREMQAGSSYLSSEDPRLHFGLGPATEVRELIVLWPDGEETVLSDVQVNQIVVVRPVG